MNRSGIENEERENKGKRRREKGQESGKTE